MQEGTVRQLPSTKDRISTPLVRPLPPATPTQQNVVPRSIPTTSSEEGMGGVVWCVCVRVRKEGGFVVDFIKKKKMFFFGCQVKITGVYIL